MLVAIRENVSKLKKQGRSLVETVEAKPTASYDHKWGQYVIDPGLFTKLVYAECDRSCSAGSACRGIGMAQDPPSSLEVTRPVEPRIF